jgi:hypothetical protein
MNGFPTKYHYRIMQLSLLFLFFILLIFPSGNFHLFSGLPLGQRHEFIWLIIFLPLVFSPNIRHIYFENLQCKGKMIWRYLLFISVLGLLIKILLFSFSSNAGFLACYRSLSAALPNEQCERSYENFPFRNSITRIDKQISFTSSRRGIPITIPGLRNAHAENWHLSFLNSKRFNYDQNAEGNFWRRRLPFSVNWAGNFDNSNGNVLEISYTGEGLITIGTTTHTLLPSYNEVRHINIPLSSGNYPLEIIYIFDDGYRIGDEIVPGPYAQFRVDIVSADNNSEREPLLANQPEWGWQIAGGVIDSILILIFFSFCWAYWGQLKHNLFIISFSTASLLGTLYFRKTIILNDWLFEYQLVSLLFLSLFLISIGISRKKGKHISAYYVVLAFAISRVLFDLGDLEQVIYHTSGDDWLTYESFGRTILETGSLRGGESVFKYEPFIRYIIFAEHILFGDGDAWTSVAFLGALNFGVYYYFSLLHSRGYWTIRRKVFLICSELSVIGLMNSDPIIKLIYRDASEVPPWIFMPMILSFLLLSKNRGKWAIGTALVGFSVITRITHLPALFFVYSIFLLSKIFNKELRISIAARYILILGAIVLLPLAHNIYYGGEFVLFRQGEQISVNMDLTPQVWLTSIETSELGRLLEARIREVFYFLDIYPNPIFAISIHGLQLLWIFSLFTNIPFWRRCNRDTKWILFLPIFYLGIYAFFMVGIYYPRKIIAGHFAMGLSTAYWAAHLKSSSSSDRGV